MNTPFTSISKWGFVRPSATTSKTCSTGITARLQRQPNCGDASHGQHAECLVDAAELDKPLSCRDSTRTTALAILQCFAVFAQDHISGRDIVLFVDN